MNERLSDMSKRVAVITGAAGGIGNGLVKAFMSSCAQVVAVDMNAEKLSHLRQEFLGSPELVTSSVDVTNAGAATEVANAAVRQFGRIDYWINGAACFPHRSLFEISASDWMRSLDVNLTAPFLGAQAAARVMVKQGTGSIVNISSLAGVRSRLGRMEYGVSKAGLDHLTRCLATELAGSGVRVNAIAPSHIDTEMISFVHESSEALESATSAVPLKRLGTVEDVVGAVLFLVSDSASFITGEVLRVDGGLGQV